MGHFSSYTSSCAVYVSLVLLFIYLHFASCEKSGNEQFDYSKGPKGPKHWGDLKEGWKLCKTGMNQSPIEISPDQVRSAESLEKLKTHYFRFQHVLVSLNHTVALDFGADAGDIKLSGTEYKLKQYHTHMPSEHIVKGTRFPLEVHLVHKTPDNNRIAVIAVVYTLGRKDHIFEKVLEVIPSLNEQGGFLGSSIDMTNFKISGEAYYRYSGSLTTPPCTEGVLWIVVKKPHTISLEQFHRFQTLLTKNNARFIQKINGRQVLYHR